MSDQKKDMNINISDIKKFFAEKYKKMEPVLKKTCAKIIVFCKKNVRFITAGVLFLLLVLVLAKCSGDGSIPSDGKTGMIKDKNSSGNKVIDSVSKEEITQDVEAKIHELIQNYYTAYAKGKVKKVASFAEPLSEGEKSFISVYSQYVKKYKNITCHIKNGLEENTYIVYAQLDVKFEDINTLAPGLETFYVRTREDSSFYIDNAYGQFNSQVEEIEMNEEVSTLIDEFGEEEDVATLRNEIQKKYSDAVASDPELKKLVETTIPEAIVAWANEQKAAAVKAEAEKKAAEEEAKKKAEEEAKKKAEEEKRAAELAAAEQVVATDKVNVRSEASETANIIGKLEAGAKTTRLEDKDGWSRIDYSNGTQGYVKSEYLSLVSGEGAQTQQEEPQQEEVSVQTDANGLAEGTVITIQSSTNIREGMSQDSEKVATAYTGEKVTVIMSYAEGWTKVSYGNKTGYIKTDLLQ